VIDKDIQSVMRTVVAEVIMEPSKESIRDNMQSTLQSSRKVNKTKLSHQDEPIKRVRHSLNIIK